MTPADIFENLVAEGLGIYADSAGTAVFNRKQLFFRYRIGSAGFNGVLPARLQVKIFSDGVKQHSKLRGRQRCGRSAAEVYTFKPELCFFCDFARYAKLLT